MSLTLLLNLDPAERDDLRAQAALRVGRLLRARTVDDNDQQIGQFTDNTRPTSNDVLEFVDDASQDVFITAGQQLGPTFTSATEPAAWVLIAIRAAMLVELSYWPQQTQAADSAYQQLSQLYDQGLRNLITAVQDNAATGVRFASVPIASDLSGNQLLTAADLIV
jgi:hypothetical protein